MIVEAIIVFCLVVVPAVQCTAPVAGALSQTVEERVARWRRARIHGGLARVRGRLHAIRPVRSPMEDVRCCIAVTHFGGRDVWGVPRRVAVVTAHDFLLETDQGLYQVRSAGLRLRASRELILAEPVRIALPPAVAQEIQASPLAAARALRWNEQIFLEGELVEVIGVGRMEQASADLPARGIRDLPVLPTLLAVDGVLELAPVADQGAVRHSGS